MSEGGDSAEPEVRSSPCLVLSSGDAAKPTRGLRRTRGRGPKSAQDRGVPARASAPERLSPRADSPVLAADLNSAAGPVSDLSTANITERLFELDTWVCRHIEPDDPIASGQPVTDATTRHLTLETTPERPAGPDGPLPPRHTRRTLTIMAVDVRLLDGPAEGVTAHYGNMSIPLPSLYWSDGRTSRQAVYHRVEDYPDPDGAWLYRAAVPPP
jgi:hypothetical protein